MRLPLLRSRITTESNAGEEIARLGTGGDKVEHGGGAERHALGLAPEVVLDNPTRGAALAQTQAEAAEVVIEIGLVAYAGRQRERLDGGVGQSHRTSWAGPGQV